MFVNNNQVSNYNRLLTRATADRLGVKPMTAAHMSDVGGPVPQAGVPYAANIAPFLSPLAIPCQQPPYGMVSAADRSEEHTSELQSLMRISYAVFCLKKKSNKKTRTII